MLKKNEIFYAFLLRDIVKQIASNVFWSRQAWKIFC